MFVELGRLVSTVLERRALAKERVAMFAKDTEFELERLVAGRAPFGARDVVRPTGLRLAQQLAKELVERDVAVASGVSGIDGAAHRAVLDAGESGLRALRHRQCWPG